MNLPIKAEQLGENSVIKEKGYSVRPILILVNGCSLGITEEKYFVQLVDFGEFLQKDSN